MTKSTDLFGERAGAVISANGLYRYRLWRVLGETGPTVAFVMLNPSTADANVDDPTIRKCIGFAKRWGCDGIDVVNLFAWRSPYPGELLVQSGRGFDVVGPDNDSHIRVAASRASLVVAAWGSHAIDTDQRAAAVLSMLPTPVCLGRCKDGSPRHPLMLGYDAELQPLPTTP